MADRRPERLEAEAGTGGAGEARPAGRTRRGKTAGDPAPVSIAARDAEAGTLAGSLAEEWQARLHATNHGWEQYANQLQERHEHERLKLQSEKERLELDNALSRTELATQIATLRMRNHELLREIEAMRAAPIRTGSRTLLWGLMRSAYRALPISPALRARITARVVPPLAWLAPYHRPAQIAAAHAMPAGQAELVAPTLRFEAVDLPEISVIVPVYNQLSYTISCLSSLARQISPHSFEVLVMDDCSTDRTEEVLSAVPGLRYARNDANLGFIGNCNRGAALARGRYLVFLNNDTFAMPGWLAALRATFDEHGDVGVVGSKLVYGDGTLQEAGGIIWCDGSGWNWGRLGDPAHPRYNYVRDVDYVSGAALMIERALFLETGGFDQELEKAYYEDTAKCFQLRRMGRRVLYQPFAEIVHHEGISHGRDIGSGIKQYQVRNRETFLRKNADMLAAHGENGVDPEAAADRLPRGHVLVIDAATPTPDQDSGSIDMLNLIRMLILDGYRVHFIPETNFANFDAYTRELQKMGVECVYSPYYASVEAFLKERGDMFDSVVMSRSNVAANVWPAVARHAPRAARIFYTVDLHFLREEREAALAGDAKLARLARRSRARELDLVGRADVTVVLSEYEREMLGRLGHGRVEVLPLIRDSPEPPTAGFSERDGVVFIGGFQHRPNVDAVRWLADAIWPRVRQLAAARGLPPFVLRIVGSKMPDSLRALACDDIEVLGFVERLDTVFGTARLAVAPLRYGAGLKGKVATSLGYGVPTVGTPLAFEGMPQDGLDSVAVVGADAAGLAEAIVDLYGDEARWRALAAAGPAYVERHFAVAALTERVRALLDRARSEAAARRDGGRASEDVAP